MEKGFLAGHPVALARALLAQVTPLRRDCGRLCGANCCRTDEDGLGGMLLYPGEEAFYAEPPAGFRLQKGQLPGSTLLTCRGVCERDTRPLACRVFPLALTIRDGEAAVEPDPRAWPVCPLMEEGLSGLRQDFVAACLDAARLLARAPAQRAFMLAQTRLMDEFTKWPWEEGGKA